MPISHNAKLHKERGNVMDAKIDSNSLAKSALEYAENFNGAVLSIDGSKYLKPIEQLIPAYVNQAFACELFLKSLLYHHEIDFPKTHNLKVLFDLLPEETQNDAKTRFKRSEPNECLDKSLEDLGDAFQFARYPHEKKGLALSPTILRNFNIVIHKIAFEKIRVPTID